MVPASFAWAPDHGLKSGEGLEKVWGRDEGITDSGGCSLSSSM